MKKRLLSVVLALCLVLGLLPGTAQAAVSGTYGKNNLTWTLDDGTLTVSGNGDMPGYFLSLDDPPWYSLRNSIKKVVISRGITSIGSKSFKDCSNLTDLSIANTVEVIDLDAFRKCTSLVSVTIPNSVTVFGGYAFGECTSLKSVTILGNVVGWNAFRGCTALENISMNNATSIESGAFSGCTSLTSVSIPKSVSSIEPGAFVKCSKLRTITVDSNNMYYSSRNGVLFNKNKTKIICYPENAGTSYTIPDGVVEIERLAFSTCSSLTSITIPSGVTYIRESAFSGCSGLTGIRIPDSVTYIGSYAFYGCSGLTDITIPDGVTDIGSNTFYGCSGLTDITIPDGVTDIGYHAFQGCSGLTGIRIPDGVTDIGLYVFCGCSGLTDITIPDSVTSIGAYAFSDCSSLTSVTIPDSVTSIEVGAFSGCSSLASVTIPDSVTSIEVGAFWNLSKLTIYCYKDSCAHKYAIEDDIKYVLLDADPDVPPEEPGEPAPSIQSVILTRDSVAVDLLTEPADFAQGSAETAAVHVAVDWDGGEAGRVFLVQDRDTYVELTSQPAAITPGTTFYPSPDNPIYAVIVNAADELLDRKVTTLRITEPEPEPEPEGTGLLVKDGLFAYRPNFTDTVDAMYDYHYDEHWFLESGYTYQHDLVRMSIRGAMSAFGAGYDSNGRNIELLMKDLEFNPEAIAINYPKTETDSIGYAIASKNITPAEGDDFEPFSLIMVAVRGGGYYEEWRGNFHIGTGVEHEGFRIAANKVLSGLKGYLNKYDGQLNENKKIWLMGFSRGSTVTNLVAKDLDDGAISGLDGDNLYAFCFACPQNTRALGTENRKYYNITNIVNPIDPVPKLVMSDWGFSRYGKTFYLPYIDGMKTSTYKQLSYRMESVYSELVKNFPNVTASQLIPGGRSQTLLTDFIATSLAKLWKDQTSYVLGREIGDGYIYWQDLMYAIADGVFVGRSSGTGRASSGWSQYISVIVDVLASRLPATQVLIVTVVLEQLVATILEQLDFPMQPKEVMEYPHYSELYLSWLDALEGEMQYADSKYRIVYVNCPVDVEVKDSDGALVGEIVNDKISDITDGVAILIDFNGQKAIMLPNNIGYTINLTAIADGEVTYTATEYDMASGRTEKVVSYYEVEVETGDTLTGTVENLSDKPDASYPLVLNGGGDAFTPDIQQSGGAVQMYSVEPSVSGSGAVTGGGTYVNGEFAKVKAIPDSGAEFLGWYIQDELVSEEAEYRFLVSENVHITAKFTDTTPPAPPSPPAPPATVFYKITFDPNGGLEGRITLTTNANGKLLAALPTPTREGYTFDGWYTELTGGEKVNADKVYRSDTTLYAHWIENALPPADVTYTITFDANGGSGVMSAVTAAEGEAFTLPDCTFTAPDGKEFKAWSIDGKEYAPGTNYISTSDTEVTAIWQDTAPAPEHTHDWETAWSCDETHHWKECSTSECPITENINKSEYGEHTYDNENAAVCSTCEYKRAVTPPAPPRPTADEETYYISIPKFTGGEIIPSTRYAEQGERVTLAAHPSTGYELDTITVTDIRGRTLALRDSGNNSYSFTMPNNRVTVEAKFTEIQASNTPDTNTPVADEPFTGLGTPGISGIVLNPAPMPFTDVRAGDWYYDGVDYVWKHYLMSGVSDIEFSPNTTTSRAMIWTVLARMNNVRTEVNPGSNWYERGMLWAMEQGITDGSNPIGDITREQLATMLWRNVGSPGAAADLSQFSDNNTVSGYAQNAVNWAVANGILNGSNGKLNPKGTATRAQVAAMVMRYGERIGA